MCQYNTRAFELPLSLNRGLERRGRGNSHLTITDIPSAHFSLAEPQLCLDHHRRAAVGDIVNEKARSLDWYALIISAILISEQLIGWEVGRCPRCKHHRRPDELHQILKNANFSPLFLQVSSSPTASRFAIISDFCVFLVCEGRR